MLFFKRFKNKLTNGISTRITESSHRQKLRFRRQHLF